MHIHVNGEAREVDVDCTIGKLIVALGLNGRAVAVEVNKQLVPKNQHESTTLREGDNVEIVTLVGGG